MLAYATFYILVSAMLLGARLYKHIVGQDGIKAVLALLGFLLPLPFVLRIFGLL